MANVREYQITVTGSGTVVLSPALQTGILVTDFWAVKTGGAGGGGDGITLQDGAGNAISDQLDMNVADTTVVRASTINDAFSSVTAAENLQVVAAGAATVASICFVAGIPQ